MEGPGSHQMTERTSTNDDLRLLRLVVDIGLQAAAPANTKLKWSVALSGGLRPKKMVGNQSWTGVDRLSPCTAMGHG